MPDSRTNYVQDYLEDAGLTPAQIQRIVYQYEQALQTGNAANWGPETLERWLSRQAQSYNNSGSNRRPDPFADVDERADEQERSFEAVQQLAREQAAERAQRSQNRFHENARIDHGPALDPDIIANSIEAGAWTDAEGNYTDGPGGPIIDEPMNVDDEGLWHAIKGQRFNMGNLAMPGVGGAGGATQAELQGLTYGRHVSTRRGFTAHPSADAMAGNARQRGTSYTTPAGTYPNRRRNFLTPSMALSMLSGMSEDYLIRLQHQLYDAGLYAEDTRPRWGVADAATRDAFKTLFLEASTQPGKNIAAVLSDLAVDRRDQTPYPDGSPGAGGAGLPTLTLPDFEPEVMNEEALRQQIRDIASESIGGYLPDDQQEALISRLREREIGLQRQQYDRDVQRVTEQYQADVAGMALGGGGGGSFADIDAFLAALSGQESGGRYDVPNASGSGAYGKYQIMPGNWPEWARRAGLPPGSRQTPQNQEIVARQIVMDYFEQFGNWRDVAVAWYAGPGNVPGKRYSDRPQSGGPSINDYADQVMYRYHAQRRGAGGDPRGMVGQTVGGRTFGAIEAFDPVAEAEAAIKAANPAAWAANEWGNRATEFFAALGSAIGAG